MNPESSASTIGRRAPIAASTPIPTTMSGLIVQKMRSIRNCNDRVRAKGEIHVLHESFETYVYGLGLKVC
jgi:hypothetical protein